MPTLNINGRKVKVDDAFLSLSPEQQNATVDEIAASFEPTKQEQATPEQPKGEQPGNDGLSMGRTVSGGLIEGIPVLGPLLRRGTEMAAAGTMAALDPNADYAEYMRRVDQANAEEKAANPVLDVGSQIAGGLAATAPVAATATGARLLGVTGPSLMGRAGMSAASGAALSGADTIARGGDAADALGAAAAGGIIGGAVPLAAAGLKAASKPVVDAVKARVNPGQFASQKVAERIANSGATVARAASLAQRDGLSLADAGGQSTRDLLRTATNIPGPARDRVSSQLTLRQMGQGDRLKNIVGRTIADPEGYLAAKDEIADTAKRLAKPLYDKAYKTPVHYSESLEGILNTPAGKAALRKAEEIAANEQVPFKQLFVQINDNGTGTVRRVPDARGWDYIKRGMDDVIEGQTDALTGKITTSGAAIVGLKKRMLSEIDRVNPAYKAARQVWGGQQQLDKALEFGRKAMTQSPETVKRAIADMSASEKEAARAGLADWIRNQVDQRSFTQNAILKFFSNRQQVKNIRAFFDNDEQFATFRKAIFAEAKKRKTYEAVTGNSTTARQLADMFESGGMKEGMDFAGRAVTQGPVSATLQFVGNRMRMLGGLTPEVADQVARRLMASDPATVKQIAMDLAKIEASNASAQIKSQNVQALISRALQTTALAGASQPR